MIRRHESQIGGLRDLDSGQPREDRSWNGRNEACVCRDEGLRARHVIGLCVIGGHGPEETRNVDIVHRPAVAST